MSIFENRVQRDLLTDTVFTEVNEEFILPDYMPEIGRVLRVSAALFPDECYVGSDAAEFSGRVEYRLLYSDGEGTLTEAPLEGRYRYRLPIGDAQIVTAYTDEEIESVGARPSAPRKLGIRTRIAAKPHLLYEETVGRAPEALIGDVPMETRRRELCFAKWHALTFGTRHAEERFLLEGIAPEALSLISLKGEMLCESATAHEGYISVRGRLLVSVMLGCVGGAPLLRCYTLPVDEELPCEGASAEDAVFLRGFCGAPALSMEAEGDGTALILDAEYTLQGCLHRNAPFTLLEDLYAHGAYHTLERRAVTAERFLGCYLGNLTVDGTVALPEGLAAEGRTLVPHFTVKERSFMMTGDRCVVTGTLSVLLLALGAGEDRCELALPFRIELPMGFVGEEGDEIEVYLSPVGGEARAAGDTLRLSTELAVAARAYRPISLSVPVSATHTKDAPPRDDSSVTVYYPSDGDTLWSVGKAYALPLETLRKQNGLPTEGEPDASDATSLDGYSYLITSAL